jgi:3'(2'), 5'-bisphosphate nucleotidase
MEYILKEKSEKIKIDRLIDLIKQSNQIANKIYNDYLNNNSLIINNKSDDSPVTKADTDVNIFLCQQLKQLYPNIPIISEETKTVPYTIRKQYSNYWCIDPIDGTKEFINKNGEFTINLGLVEDNKVVLGIVSHPPKNVIYYAIHNQGAYKLLDNGDISKLSSKKENIENIENPNIICSRSHMNKPTQDFLKTFSNYNLISRGSSLKFMSIAEGIADIYPRLNGSMEWDTCASHIIVKEAGARIVLYDDQNKTLEYNKVNLLNPFFIVYR